MAELPIYLVKLKDSDAKITNYLAIDIPSGGRFIKNWKMFGQTVNGLISSEVIYQGTGEIISQRQTNLHKDGKYYATLTFPGAMGTLKFNEVGSFEDKVLFDGGEYHKNRTATFIGEGNIVNGEFVTKRIRQR